MASMIFVVVSKHAKHRQKLALALNVLVHAFAVEESVQVMINLH